MHVHTLGENLGLGGPMPIITASGTSSAGIQGATRGKPSRRSRSPRRSRVPVAAPVRAPVRPSIGITMPGPKPVRAIYDPLVFNAASGNAELPFYGDFIFSREKLQEMKAAGRAAAAELTAKQGNPGGDGPALDLEQKAIEAEATEKAVKDSAGGNGGARKKKGKKNKTDFSLLALAGALAYLII